jgi:MFS family permease
MVQLRRPAPAASAVKPDKRPVFHGWRIVRSGLLIQMLHSGLVFNAFSLFAAQLKGEFGWSNSVFGTAFALNRAESGILGPLQGWMTDRFGPRWVLRVGAVIMAVGFLLFSSVTSIVGFYLTYLLIAIGSSLAGFLTITVAVVHWFEKRRSKALAISSMGFGIGGMLAFGVGVVIDAIGWRNTARVAAVLSLVLILLLSRHFERRPADLGLHPDGIDPDAGNGAGDVAGADGAGDTRTVTATAPSAIHFTAREAMRTRAFWFISLGHASALLVVGASMAHLALFLADETSLGHLHTSVVIGALPAMMAVGQLVGGHFGDLYDKRKLVTVAMAGHCSGLLVLSVARSTVMIWLFVLLHGLAWGVRGPLQQAMRADYFGASDFGKIMGFSSLIIMTGMMVGPITAGVIADSTGSFRLAFAILGVAAGLGGFWFWFATPPSPPVRVAPTVDHERAGSNE